MGKAIGVVAAVMLVIILAAAIPIIRELGAYANDSNPYGALDDTEAEQEQEKEDT